MLAGGDICIPSQNNLMLVRRMGGHYSKINGDVMETIVLLCQDGKVTCKVLHNLICHCIPLTVSFDAQYLNNMHTKAKSLLPQCQWQTASKSKVNVF